MLPDRFRQLLTAYVDDELDARQRRQAVRLLRRSREARRLLRKLQSDSRVLKGLPEPPPLAVDLSEGILRTIAARKLKTGGRPALPPLTPAGKPLPTWAALAAAAAVLFAVGLGSYLFFSPAPDLGLDRPMAEGKGIPLAPEVRKEEKKVEIVQREEPKEKPPVVKPDEKEQLPPMDAVVVVPAEEEEPKEEKLPEAPPKPGVVLGAPGNVNLEKLEKVEITLPVVVKLHDLESPLERDKFLRQVRAGEGYRVELLCRDATKAVERLRPFLQAGQVNVQMDANAQARLKKPQWKTEYGLYLENVTPVQLAGILAQAGAEDRKGTTRKPPDVRFDGLMVVHTFSRVDRQELTDLLGADPTRMPPPSRGTLAPDIHKPLSDITRTQIGDALDGKGPPRPGTPAAPGFLLAIAGGRVKPGQEAKRFLESRAPLRADTVRALLIFRNVN